MEQAPLAQPGLPSLSAGRRMEYLRGFGILLLIAVVGLYVVKWNPYFHKALKAATAHSLGASIVTGKGAAPPAPSLAAGWDYAVAYFKAIWQAMVLGLLLAATVETLVPRDWLARVLGRPSARSSLLGGAIALPGMMCTCCTAPVALGLRRAGVAVGSAVAFFLGNPTLNPAVLVFLLFTLGWRWAALRLVLGVALVFGAAALANRLTHGAEVDAAAVVPPAPPATRGNLAARWLAALGRLALWLIPEYIVIVLALGAARAFLFPAITPQLGDSVLLLVGLAVAGTLFVIPTAGEIPIIQTLMAFGLGAGPAGALLLTLAPVSLPSLAMVWRAFPRRVLLLLAGLTALAGLAAGLLAMALGL